MWAGTCVPAVSMIVAPSVDSVKKSASYINVKIAEL